MHMSDLNAQPQNAQNTPNEPPRVSKVPVYSVDEIAERIAEGSVDVNRLAATVATQQATINAMANWINAQIGASGAGGTGSKARGSRGSE